MKYFQIILKNQKYKKVLKNILKKFKFDSELYFKSYPKMMKE